MRRSFGCGLSETYREGGGRREDEEDEEDEEDDDEILSFANPAHAPFVRLSVHCSTACHISLN